MNDNLTKEEEMILYSMESAGKWDILLYDLALLIPSAIIIILSAVYGSTVGIYSGLITYSFLRLWTSIRKCKAMPSLKSAIAKLKRTD